MASRDVSLDNALYSDVSASGIMFKDVAKVGGGNDHLDELAAV